MSQSFKSLSLYEFQERFPDDRSCYKYLAELKWKDGYTCHKCGHKKYCDGIKEFDRQCTSCRYVESPTANTLFHMLKFSIHQAFYIVYFVSTSKKGIASTELSRKLGLRQKTCWSFKMKVVQAMESSMQHPMNGEVDVDEFVIGGQETNTRGRKNKKKKLVVLGVEKKGKGASRIYMRHINQSSSKELGGFMKDFIDKMAEVRTDGWTGYIPLKEHFPLLIQEKSGKKGENFTIVHRIIMNLKSWLRGTHGHAKHLQYYLDEYCYRFNRHFMEAGIFDNLLRRMVHHKPLTMKQIIS